MPRFLQRLESRYLFAFDLAPTALTDVEVTSGQKQFSFFALFANVGSTEYDGRFIANYYLTRDKVVGNSDDLFAGDSVVQERISSGNSITPLLVNANIPASATGEYYLGVTVTQQFGGSEQNTKNNKLVTGDIAVNVTRQAQWESATINGTEGNDIILVTLGHVSLNGDDRTYPFKTLSIDAGLGNDKIVASADSTIKLSMTGAGGNDTMIGGTKADEISGGNGKDKLFGSGDDDYLIGGASADYLNGEDGNDICSGGGGNDRVYGLVGADYLLGGAGDDVFVSRDLVGSTGLDTLSGNSGIDRAQLDANDSRASIEELLA